MSGPAAALLARRVDWGRAPSAHNTQPWVVRVVAPDTLTVGWAAERTLPLGDPTGRDLLLSLGCAVEALVVTAADLGYGAHVTWAVDRPSRRAATLRLWRGPGLSRFSVGDLQARGTARGPYQEPALTVREVAALAEDLAQDLACERGDAGGSPSGLPVRLAVLPDALVDAQLPVADRWALEGPAAGELAGWLRLSRRHPAYQLDGLTDVALGLSRPAAVGLRLVLSAPGRRVLRLSGAARLLAAAARQQGRGTVVALTAPAGLSDEEVGDLGRHLLRAWLAAGRRGWSAHPLSQLLDCPSTAAALQRHVAATAATQPAAPSVPTGGVTAYAVFRLGRPEGTPRRSHRLPSSWPPPLWPALVWARVWG